LLDRVDDLAERTAGAVDQIDTLADLAGRAGDQVLDVLGGLRRTLRQRGGVGRRLIRSSLNRCAGCGRIANRGLVGMNLGMANGRVVNRTGGSHYRRILGGIW
jgi:hypothetical protein